jgi:hypothetical protein
MYKGGSEIRINASSQLEQVYDSRHPQQMLLGDQFAAMHDIFGV